MTLAPSIRKLLLTSHVTFSVGWLGAVAAYLALALLGVTSADSATVRAAYPSMEWIGWLVIVPSALAALLSGLVQSLATEWGLVRHWWIVAKLALGVGGTTILLMHMPAVSRMAGIAAQRASADTDPGRLPMQLVIHAAGGILVLLAATTLSVYKPWGRTPYGRRLVRPE